MTKKRVFEIAKEYNVSVKEVLDVLNKNNINLSSNLAAIDDNSAKIIQKNFSGKLRPDQHTEEKKFHSPAPTPPAAPIASKIEQKPAVEIPKVENKPVSQNTTQRTQQRPPQRPPHRPSDSGNTAGKSDNYRGGSNQGRPPYQSNNNQSRPPYQGNNQTRPAYTNNNQPVRENNNDNRPSAAAPNTSQSSTAPNQNRPPYQGNNQNQGSRPPYQGNNQNQGSRPPYQGNNQNQGSRPPYQGNNQNQGSRPPYQGNNQNQGSRPPYQGNNQNQGSRPPYQGNNQNQGSRPPYQGNNQNQGSRPPYQGNNQNQGSRPPYQGNNQNQGSRPPYQGNNQNQGSRPPYQGNNQNQGSRPPYQQRNNNQGSRPPYQNNRPQQTPAAPGGSLLPPADAIVPQKQNTFTNKAKQHDKGQGRNDWGKKNQSKDDFNNRQKNSRNNKTQQSTPPREIKRPDKITVGEFITVKDLASRIKCEPSEIIKKLFLLGVMVTINQDIDFDTATLVAGDFGIEVLELPPEQDPTEVPEVEDDPAKRVLRPPVVTVMGHVDHGKTSLLDAIRKANVTAKEAGGITQHIGAYQVTINNKKIVFLDTPGHEAFTSMRARGAKVTDVAILVVAADDGVMPQTIEAINHAKSAEVPIIVAINKIDKENANLDRIKQQLSEHELVAEDWGGDTIMVPVSAKQKKGLSELLEMILLVAEMQELKANPTIAATGTIIEAQLDKGRGPVATVLVQKGTLEIGDTIVAGTAFGKVRAMINDRGEKVKKAPPSTPVEVLGLSDVPQAGDTLQVTEERIARSVAEKRIAKKRIEEMQQSQKVSLDDLFKQIQDGKVKDLNILVKADVQGTIEALKQSLVKIKNEEVKVVIVHAGVGAINESDVMLASASNALIIGFNVRPDGKARKTAETEKVDMRLYSVIYDAINDVEAAIKGMLAPKFEEQVIGKVEIRKVMIINKMPIAGCYVLEGKVTNNSLIRIVRDGIVVHTGKIDTLKRFKDDAKEVASGYECGLTLENYRDVKENDILEVYKMQEVEAE